MINFGRIFFLLFYIMLNIVLSMQISERNTNDAIGFPEIEENPLMANKQNRQPVFIPSLCPENQLLYPGDQSDDWICDCRPGHLYHPTTDKCWPAYQRGPCKINEHLVLNKKSAIPLCTLNPCKKNGSVIWNGKCEEIGKPCGETFPISVLWVNAATVEIDCVPVFLVESRFTSDFKINCPAGSKRDILNKCVPSLQ